MSSTGSENVRAHEAKMLQDLLPNHVIDQTDLKSDDDRIRKQTMGILTLRYWNNF